MAQSVTHPEIDIATTLMEEIDSKRTIDIDSLNHLSYKCIRAVMIYACCSFNGLSIFQTFDFTYFNEIIMNSFDIIDEMITILIESNDYLILEQILLHNTTFINKCGLYKHIELAKSKSLYGIVKILYQYDAKSVLLNDC